MHLLILLVLFIGLLYGPQLWARMVLNRYNKETDDFPGTGGQFAHHLLNRFGLSEVQVEATANGDHYDPTTRTVRLGEDHYHRRSLAAIVVAAHEVGHALQHAQNYRPFTLRNQMVGLAQQAERLGSMTMLAIPVLTAMTRAPSVGVLTFIIGLCSLALPVVVHLITLPVEWHASFHRALPVLRAGAYLNDHQLPAARRILTACAFTYVASSLASLLNLWRWLRILRR